MSPASSTRRLRAPAHVLARELDGETILLNLESACYFGLKTVGTQIWRALCAAASVEEARQALLAAYEVNAVQLHNDLEQFIEALAQHGLVAIHLDAEPNDAASATR